MALNHLRTTIIYHALRCGAYEVPCVRVLFTPAYSIYLFCSYDMGWGSLGVSWGNNVLDAIYITRTSLEFMLGCDISWASYVITSYVYSYVIFI